MALLNRQARVEKQIKRALLPILLTYGCHDVRSQVMIQSIRISRDLSYAKVFVMARQNDATAALLAQLNAQKPVFRKALACAISLKKVPDLKFYIDALSEAEVTAQRALNKIDTSGGCDASSD